MALEAMRTRMRSSVSVAEADGVLPAGDSSAVQPVSAAIPSPVTTLAPNPRKRRRL